MSEHNPSKLKTSDRVKRVNGTGCYGTIKEIRTEVMASAVENSKEKPLLINVLWDNGSLSYFSPAGLELVKE